jgi:hypothetical protein
MDEEKETKMQIKENAIHFLKQIKDCGERGAGQIIAIIKLLEMEVIEMRINEKSIQEQEEYFELKDFLLGVGCIQPLESRTLGVLKCLRKEYLRDKNQEYE